MIILLFLFGLFIDYIIFRYGYSWAFFSYETLIILGALFSRKRKIQTAVILFLLLIGLKVLYYVFHLRLQYLIDVGIFTAASLFSLLALIAISRGVELNNARNNITILTAFFISIFLLDKFVVGNYFASLFLPHFLKFNNSAKIFKSENLIYQNIKKIIQSDDGVTLIVWESLGAIKDEKYIDGINLPLVKESKIKWEGGSTLDAEIRYLCGTNYGFNENKCLPYFDKHGIAYHGNSLNYFSRYGLYKKMGFNKYSGKTELKELKTCSYAYDAICDSEIFSKLFQEINKNNGCKGFTYFLTIDSHFPYNKYSNHVDGLKSDVQKVLMSLSDLSVKFKSCKFLVVGDHPPPLANRFDSNNVAYFSIGLD